MTYVKVTYIAQNEDNKPITTAHTFADIEKALHVYFGVDKAQAQCLGFYPYQTKYPDDYEGYFEYSYQHNGKTCVEKIKIFCIEFFPHTIYQKSL